MTNLHIVKPDTAKSRAEKELADLIERITKINDFENTQAFSYLSSEQQNLLTNQYTVMVLYADILERRIEIWEE
jgi:virulence-associated protein VapD